MTRFSAPSTSSLMRSGGPNCWVAWSRVMVGTVMVWAGCGESLRVASFWPMAEPVSANWRWPDWSERAAWITWALVIWLRVIWDWSSLADWGWGSKAMIWQVGSLCLEARRT